MLVNSKEMLIAAKHEKLGVPQFNVNNLENIKWALEIAEESQYPIIIGVSEGAIKYMGGKKTVVAVTKALISSLDIKQDVVLHLDHGSSVESCEEAIDCGFTSVMYDGSRLPIDENISNTNQVVAYASFKNVSVEGELGYLGTNNEDVSYTSLEDAFYYINNTRIDALAIAIGNVHGIYKESPNLQFDLLEQISNKCSIPLVLHGGSGISNEDFIKTINKGISKININTELQIQWSKAIRDYLEQNKEVYDPRKIISSGEENFKKTMRDYIKLFQNKK